MFLHNPLTGIGVGDYADANGGQYWPIAERRIYLDAHSMFFKIIGELGLFGLITFAGMVTILVRTNIDIRKQLEKANGPPWLCALPRATNYVIFVLLFAGYASHDVYRSTWYLLAGLTAATSAMVAAQTPGEFELAAPAPAPPPEAAAGFVAAGPGSLSVAAWRRSARR
jgi:O-antigen ligase